jgi:hypothetical protein
MPRNKHLCCSMLMQYSQHNLLQPPPGLAAHMDAYINATAGSGMSQMQGHYAGSSCVTFGLQPFLRSAYASALLRHDLQLASPQHRTEWRDLALNDKVFEDNEELARWCCLQPLQCLTSSMAAAYSQIRRTKKQACTADRYASGQGSSSSCCCGQNRPRRGS